MFLISKQCSAVVKRILSTAFREKFMCLSGLQSTRKSCIILCVCLACSAVLNFLDESFSCLGKQINVSLVFSVAKWLFTVLMLSHVIIGLWSVKFDGSFNNEFAIEWNISLGRILHSLCVRRKKGRGREKSAKEGKREGKEASLTLSPQSPSFFSSSLSPSPFDACYTGYILHSQQHWTPDLPWNVGLASESPRNLPFIISRSALLHISNRRFPRLFNSLSKLCRWKAHSENSDWSFCYNGVAFLTDIVWVFACSRVEITHKKNWSKSREFLNIVFKFFK